MSFSIDESKVEELMQAELMRYPPPYAVSGASYAAPVLVTAESRERLVALRRKIEESGSPLRSADELAREIAEMRKGNR